MKFQDYIQKHKYLLLIIAVLLIMILGKTNTEWNLLRTVWEILLPFLVGCIMAFILNIPMRFIEKRLFRNKSDIYRVSTRIASFLLTLLHTGLKLWYKICDIFIQHGKTVRQLRNHKKQNQPDDRNNDEQC